MDKIDAVEKVVNSEVAKRAYEDALSGPATEVGRLAQDLMKTFRLFLAPIQLLASSQDRLGRWLEEIRLAVPADRQVQAPPEVAGPALLNLRFLDDTNVLKDLYLNLLKCSIDRRTQQDTHPGFVKVIEHLSSDDARLLYWLSQLPAIEEKLDEHNPAPLSVALKKHVPQVHEWTEKKIGASVDLLKGQSILNCQIWVVADFDEPFYKQVSLELTEYGKCFVRICIPDNWRGEHS